MSVRLIRYAFCQRASGSLGLALILVGFACSRPVPSDFGQLSSVQPLVATELLFLVLILGVWFRYHLGMEGVAAVRRRRPVAWPPSSWWPPPGAGT